MTGYLLSVPLGRRQAIVGGWAMAANLLIPLLSLGQTPPPVSGDQPPGPAARTYRNPVLDRPGAADPAVIHYQGSYYLYPTLDSSGYDVFVSSNLVHWRHEGKCFTDGRRGVWARMCSITSEVMAGSIFTTR